MSIPCPSPVPLPKPPYREPTLLPDLLDKVLAAKAHWAHGRGSECMEPEARQALDDLFAALDYSLVVAAPALATFCSC